MSSYYIYYTTNQNNEQLNYITDIRLTYIYSLQKDHDLVCPYFFHVCLQQLQMLVVVLSLLLSTSLAAEPSLDKHVISLYGNATLGYYYANIYVGTPPQEQSVIIDTGSGQLALPCSKCTNCGDKHIHLPFKLTDSTTSKILTCNSQEQLCTSSCSQKGGTDPCTFSISYAEGSSLSGIIIEDDIQFESDSVGESITTAFGCTTKETNLFFTQAANGIFGLAPKRQARLLDLLYQKHSKATGERLMFSLCLAKNGGQLVIGKPKEELHNSATSVKTTFNAGKNLYSLQKVGEIRMGDSVIHKDGQFAGMFGFFIDSGSTFTYLPRSNFKSLEVALENACALVPEKCLVAKNKPSCYKIIHNQTITIKQKLNEIFPDIEIEIDGEIVDWSPSKYFLLKSLANGEVCLGIQPLDRYILGANWMVDRDIVFDIPGQTVEIFSNSTCLLHPVRPEQRVAKQVDELPVYTGDAKPQHLSYIEAVLKIDSNFTTFLVALLLVVCFLLILLICVGKMFGPKKQIKKVAQDEEIENMEEGSLASKRAADQLSREQSQIFRSAITIIPSESPSFK